MMIDHPSSTLATPVAYTHASWRRDSGAGKYRWEEDKFVREGGFRENLLKKRLEYKRNEH